MVARDTAPLGGRPVAPELSLVIFHQDGSEVLALGGAEAFTIGRDVRADLAIADRSLSKEHARIEKNANTWVVRDLGSLNGTFVNGARVGEGVPQGIEAGDEVAFGGVVALVVGPRAKSEPLASGDHFRRCLEEELVRARWFRRTFAVLWCALPARSAKAIEKIRALLSPVDSLALYSADRLQVLLSEASRMRAEEVVRAIEGADPKIRVKIAYYPDSGTSVDAILSASASGSASGSEDGDEAPDRGSDRAPDGRRDRGSEVLFESAAMRAVMETVGRVARTSIPALITGETGSGKEVVARALHAASKRAQGPFVALNCGAIPRALVESTLFGHEKGAFTGADERRRGAFEAAGGGTLFLDEIGELPADAQAALLRVLETKRLSRVGSTEEFEVEVRVLAATHRDLESLANAGLFRMDLYYRLNAVVIEVPPLRERVEEIAPLAEMFLARAREHHGSSVRGFEAPVLEAFSLYSWPGNVRELRNVVERAAVLAAREVIAVEDLPPRVREVLPERAETAALDEGGEPGLREKLIAYEIQLIKEALEKTGDNQTEAARVLGLPRRTLVHKLRALRSAGAFEER